MYPIYQPSCCARSAQCCWPRGLGVVFLLSLWPHVDIAGWYPCPPSAAKKCSASLNASTSTNWKILNVRSAMGCD
ncbi:hypothetical protein C8F04DRAFT_1062218, partial [Mycena alexandri]